MKIIYPVNGMNIQKIISKEISLSILEQVTDK